MLNSDGGDGAAAGDEGGDGGGTVSDGGGTVGDGDTVGAGGDEGGDGCGDGGLSKGITSAGGGASSCTPLNARGHERLRRNSSADSIRSRRVSPASTGWAAHVSLLPPSTNGGDALHGGRAVALSRRTTTTRLKR